MTSSPVGAGPVVVVGLGPGDPLLLSPALGEVLARIPERRFVRTTRHPTAGAVAGATSFDDVYDGARTLEEVYREIVERLVEAAAAGPVLYAVPGSPLVAERTVALLRDDPRVAVEVMPAVSFLDVAWARLGVDPLAAGVRLVDGQRFEVEAAGCPGPMLVAQCDSAAVLSEIKLAAEDGPDVTVLHHLGLPDEAVETVAWEDLDRAVAPDHLTSLWIPGLQLAVAAEVTRLVELVRTLRERCPWDRQQTHRSLTRHLVEETYEVLEAIDELPAGGAAEEEEGDGTEAGEAVDHLEEELGDLLFQVAFHATLASEQGWFTLADVARGVHDKLVGRHPHVFGDVVATTPGAVMANWEVIKRAEKGRRRVMDGVSGNLPALLYAEKVQRRAASVGFDWPAVDGARRKVDEELAELDAEIGSGGEPSPAVAAEMGDLLFAAVNVARHLGVDPEAALRQATAKFRRRFDAVEDLAAGDGQGSGAEVMAAMGLDALDRLWERVKDQGA